MKNLLVKTLFTVMIVGLTISSCSQSEMEEQILKPSVEEAQMKELIQYVKDIKPYVLAPLDGQTRGFWSSLRGWLLNSTCKCNRILINNLFKFFVWREGSKSFTRSIIEFIFNPLNLFVGYFTKVLTLWDILPDKPVGVFIGTTFP